MKRKSFLKGTLGIAAAGALLGGSGKTMAQDTAAVAGEKKMAAKNKFLLGWLTSWLGNMKKDLPEAEKVQIIEDNGRACAERGGSLAWAKSFNGDLDKFLAAKRNGNKVNLSYEKCFCPLVADIKEPLPADYCLCTQGWTKAVYGAIAGKEVMVELKSSIQRGDPKCQIVVDLS